VIDEEFPLGPVSEVKGTKTLRFAGRSGLTTPKTL
jgi:hypothetical protein